MGPAVLDQTELEKSRVYWPLSLEATCVFCSSNAFLVLVIGELLKLCDATKTCTSDTWRKSMWGERASEKAAHYCERKGEGFLQENWNSLSNLAFAYVGFTILTIGIADCIRLRRNEVRRRRNHVIEWPGFTIYFGLVVLYLFTSSFSFHAHRTTFTQVLDVAGVFVPISAVCLYPVMYFVNINSSALVLASLRWLHLGFLSSIGLFMVYTYSAGGLTTTDVTVHGVVGLIVPFLILLVLIELASRSPALRKRLYPREQMSWHFKCKPLLLATFVELFLGYIVNEDGLVKELPCNPRSAFQFHALWHLLAAACTLTMYLFLRSRCIVYENEERDRDPMIYPYLDHVKGEASTQNQELDEKSPLQSNSPEEEN